MKTTSRRHDLDWLRILAFAILILYHVGQFFDPNPWYIKNNELVEWLYWPMGFMRQWRLPLLFAIAGMGTYYALSKRNLTEFIGERISRLIVPLIIGIVLILPPQDFVEAIVKRSFDGDYIDFLQQSRFFYLIPEWPVNWHHLWFLPFLFGISALLSPFLVWYKRNSNFMVPRMSRLLKNPISLMVLIIPLFFIEILMVDIFLYNLPFLENPYMFSYYLTFFLAGFIIVSLGKEYWERIKETKLVFLSLMFLSGIAMFLLLRFGDGDIMKLLENFIEQILTWSTILTIFCYSSIFLNKPSRWLNYFNRGVLPLYILHQTITVVAGYYIKDLEIGYLPKLVFLTAITFGLSWLIYDLIILRITWLHALFGLKKRKATTVRQKQIQ